MITDILITRAEGNVSIHTATDADKDDYIAFNLDEALFKSLIKVGAEKDVDVK